jgi:heme/copper-type cytochrome/quinol oxidase subunit 2
MGRKLTWKELAGVLSVILILAGLPLLLWYWEAVAVANHYPPGTKVITLTAVAEGGIWTMDDVAGYNYWAAEPRRVKEIPLNQGDHVVLRLRSADVLHSFAIPILRLGPVDVPAGHTVELEFDADRAGTLTFLCWQMCSPEHPQLRGRFLVTASDEEEEAW